MNKLIPEITTQPDIIKIENGIRFLGYTPENFGEAIEEYMKFNGIPQGDMPTGEYDLYSYDTFTDEYPFYVIDMGKYRYILEQKLINNEWINQ